MQLETIAQRLRWAREKHGKYKTPTDAARAFGWKVSTYLGHENGDRNPSRATAKRYAKAYHVRWEWLLENEGPLPGTEQRSLQSVLQSSSHIRVLRQAFERELEDLNMSETDWNDIEVGAELPPALILSLHDVTRLPLSFIRHGLVDELSAEAAKQLLSAMLQSASAPANRPRQGARRARSRLG